MGRKVGISNNLHFHVELVHCFLYLKVREGNEAEFCIMTKKLNYLRKYHYSVSLHFGTEVHAHVTRL